MCGEFGQYEGLYWIGRLGSFHASARHLRTSQAAISLRIRSLERELGVVLFERGHNGVRPTPRGHALLPYAARLIELAADIQRWGGAAALNGRVRFGSTSVHAFTWLPTLVQQMAVDTPGITIDLTRARGIARSLADPAVRRALDLVALSNFADRPATMLSGGQQQRVALARAIAFGTPVVLFDEPLSNLDAQLRVQMREELGGRNGAKHRPIRLRIAGPSNHVFALGNCLLAASVGLAYYTKRPRHDPCLNS